MLEQKIAHGFQRPVYHAAGGDDHTIRRIGIIEEHPGYIGARKREVVREKLIRPPVSEHLLSVEDFVLEQHGGGRS